MSKILFVNACTNRATSRTYRLARELIKALDADSVEEIVLEETDLRPLHSDTLREREELASKGEFPDRVFGLANQFKKADAVVLASPYWESSYNGMTKLYLENVSQLGLTFRYDERGIPCGLTSVKTLYYVTTRGGYCGDDNDLGYLNACRVMSMFGVKDMKILSAEGLDIVGNDVDKIMSEAIGRIPSVLQGPVPLLIYKGCLTYPI